MWLHGSSLSAFCFSGLQNAETGGQSFVQSPVKTIAQLRGLQKTLREEACCKCSDLGVPTPYGRNTAPMGVYHRRGCLIDESQESVSRAKHLPGDVGDEVDQHVDLTSIGWKPPLDRRLRSRKPTRPLQFTDMEERSTPKSELLQHVVLTVSSSNHLLIPPGGGARSCIMVGDQRHLSIRRRHRCIRLVGWTTQGGKCVTCELCN